MYLLSLLLLTLSFATNTPSRTNKGLCPRKSIILDDNKTCLYAQSRRRSTFITNCNPYIIGSSRDELNAMTLMLTQYGSKRLTFAVLKDNKYQLELFEHDTEITNTSVNGNTISIDPQSNETQYINNTSENHNLESLNLDSENPNTSITSNMISMNPQSEEIQYINTNSNNYDKLICFKQIDTTGDSATNRMYNATVLQNISTTPIPINVQTTDGKTLTSSTSTDDVVINSSESADQFYNLSTTNNSTPIMPPLQNENVFERHTKQEIILLFVLIVFVVGVCILIMVISFAKLCKTA